MNAPVYDRHGIRVHHGDCLDVMRTLPSESVHAVVTDPPAGIRFMNRAWDSDMGGRHSWVAWLAERMREAHRVLKPGAYGIVWALPRTSHWTAWALEDAGFEIRDCVVHLFGAGFPKSRDVGKDIDRLAGAEREIVGPAPYSRGRASQSYSDTRRVSYDYDPQPITAPATDAARQWDGWGTSLKPSQEMWWLIRKPMSGTVAQTVLQHGTGALNIGACKVDSGPRPYIQNAGRADPASCFGAGKSGSVNLGTTNEGRWPANVVLTHAAKCDVDGCRPEWCPVAELDAQSGVSRDGVAVNRNRQPGTATSWYGTRNSQTGDDVGYGGEGGASRFFHTFRWEAKAPPSERPVVGGKAHETVKPLALCRFFVRLVCAPGGTVLDCFAGTGTTGQAARAEGMKAILIEQDADHIDKIRARLDARPKTTAADAAPATDEPLDLLDLLDGNAS